MLGRALYVGAGTDIPVSFLPTHAVVCVDGQPYSEFGMLRCDCCDGKVDHCFSRKRFLAELDRAATEGGFAGVEVNGDVRTYSPRLKYLTNTALPDHIQRVARQGPYDTIIVRGHHPHRCVLETLGASENTFVGFESTVYRQNVNDGDEDTLVNALHNSQIVRDRFRAFVFVSDDGLRLHCARWEDFVRISVASHRRRRE